MVQKRPHLVRVTGNLGWADGFMRLLRVGGFGFVDARCIWQVMFAITLVNILPDRGNRLAAKLNTIGTHIGDQTGGLTANIDAFIEFLGNLHRAAGGKT